MMAGVGIWLDFTRQHEHALYSARRLCQEHDVQLLDHTVALTAMKLRWRTRQCVLERHYAFEVSTTGNNRQPGTLWMVGGRLAGVSATWLKPTDTASLEARAIVAEALDRISHDCTHRDT